MPTLVRNILAVVAGVVLGSIVNMGIIMMSGSVIPPPAGADVSTNAGLKASMHLFEAKHFIFPFLAHALGTFTGAYIAARVAISRKLAMAMVIGCFFLIGGIMSVVMLPSPLWFTLLDLILAYLPTAYLAGKLGSK
ncbi:MAG TPA: hypothetical protein PL009_08115 [Flavipsychrobacter sp.]|nr:hypothetical protein [Flavipsychrobacter sp.]